MTTKELQIDTTRAFQFIQVNDFGSRRDGDGTCCPHCGADCRYVYTWAEYGKLRSAAAGCYKALTGKLEKDDLTKFLEVLEAKQAKGKPLNGWQKTVIKMLQFIKEGKYSESWCMEKINAAIADQKSFAASKWGGR